jgi:hypothetical protein
MDKSRRVTGLWWVTEGKDVSLLKAQLAVAALSELRAGEREHAAKVLAELARR